MGFLKKLTKPISKILDKIIPNEIKPALPYLSAFAPFMPGMQGIMGSTMLKRGLMSGALNLGSQLSQEGSEGEFNPLSLALASGIGAFSAPGQPGTAIGPAGKYGTVGYEPSAEQFFMEKASGMDSGLTKSGLEMLGKGSKYLTKASQTFQDNPFSKEGLKAAIVPASQGTADLAMIFGRQALDEYNAGLEEGSDAWYDDNARRVAIRSAMEAAGHVEDDILDALASLGLRQGGIVGLRNGGRIGFDTGGNWITKKKKNWITKKDKKISLDDIVSDVLDDDEEDDEVIEWITKKADGGITRIGFDTGGDTERKKKAIEIADTYGVTLDMAYRILRDLEDMTTGDDWKTTPYLVEELIKKEYADPYIKEYAGDAFGTGPTFTKKSIEKHLDTYFDKAKPILKDLDYRTDDYKKLETPSKIGTPGMLTIENVQSQNPFAQGGRINKEGGGMMSVLPKGTEMDYRGGGMIPMGSKERADDVPARLSKNEFVMTADAVRAAGGGSVNRGAKRMYDLMHNLEARV